ncbi:MAG: hypothetical protein KDN22_04170 [Verrucomicrobiae bacterium]|nr:hypothetical protein [Verrucomicrobiae bacterium]
MSDHSTLSASIIAAFTGGAMGWFAFSSGGSGAPEEMQRSMSANSRHVTGFEASSEFEQQQMWLARNDQITSADGLEELLETATAQQAIVLAERFGGTYPEILLTFLESRDRSQLDQFTAVASVLFTAWGKADLVRAETAAESFTTRSMKSAALVPLLNQAFATDWDTGAGFLRRQIHNWWLSGIPDAFREDPVKALDLIDSLPPSGYQDRASKAMLQVLAEQDPAAAIERIRTSLNPKFWDYGPVAKIWVEQDPAGVKAYIKALGPGSAFLAMVPKVAEALASHGFDDALEWFNECTAVEPDLENQRNYLLSKMLAPDSIQNDAAADALVNDFSDDPKLRSAAISAVTRTWIEEDPVAAMHWAGNLESEDERGEAIVATLGHWLEYDGGSAVDWLRSLPQGSARKAVVAAIGNKQFPEGVDKAALLIELGDTQEAEP